MNMLYVSKKLETPTAIADSATPLVAWPSWPFWPSRCPATKESTREIKGVDIWLTMFGSAKLMISVLMLARSLRSLILIKLPFCYVLEDIAPKRKLEQRLYENVPFPFIS